MSGDLAFYLTPAHECGYLPGRRAVNIVADPERPPDIALYSRLAALGFRRSGGSVYRPNCPGCAACIPLRVPVGSFQPNRTQRRIWRRNADLVVSERDALFEEEHFALYRRYLAARHAGGGMDDPTPEDYLSFLRSAGIDTRFFDFRCAGRCIAVAVADRLTDGLSAVYTFFDPEEARRSPGVYAVLWEIEAARRAGARWLYLGYWIRDCRKMNYKNAYRPCEVLVGGRWRPFRLSEGSGPSARVPQTHKA